MRLRAWIDKLLFNTHSVNIRTTSYMRKTGAHASTMPEDSLGYF